MVLITGTVESINRPQFYTLAYVTHWCLKVQENYQQSLFIKYFYHSKQTDIAEKLQKYNKLKSDILYIHINLPPLSTLFMTLQSWYRLVMDFLAWPLTFPGLWVLNKCLCGQSWHLVPVSKNMAGFEWLYQYRLNFYNT